MDALPTIQYMSKFSLQIWFHVLLQPLYEYTKQRPFTYSCHGRRSFYVKYSPQWAPAILQSFEIPNVNKFRNTECTNRFINKQDSSFTTMPLTNVNIFLAKILKLILKRDLSFQNTFELHKTSKQLISSTKTS